MELLTPRLRLVPLGRDHGDLLAALYADLASIRTAESLGFTFDREDETSWNPVVVYRRTLAPQ